MSVEIFPRASFPDRMTEESQQQRTNLADAPGSDIVLPHSTAGESLTGVVVVSNPPLQETLSGWRKVRHVVGLDRAIGFTVLARGWSGIAGLVTLRLIAKYLSLDQQGYYFTFGSLVALQIVFELGFSSVILQLASHEAAHLKIYDGQVSGDTVFHQRLASVLQRSTRWYSVAAVLMACTVIPTGIHFFSSSANKHPGHPVAWFFPWCAVVLAATCTFQIDPTFSFLEGCGYVSQVARTRFWQSVFGNLLAWGALLLHHGLFAPAMLIGGQAFAGAIWILTQRKLLSSLLRLPTGKNRISWAEVWPFQWRIAVSWLAGYFIFQLFNPILLWYWGPAAAGQMGMSLTLMNALLSITLSWIYTKASPFGQMIARKEYAKLDHVFFRALAQSVALCVLGSLVLWLGDVYLYAHHSPYALRVLAPLPFGILMCCPILTQISNSQALYLRAHKQEKFLIPSVVGAVFVALSTYFLGKYFGAIGVVSGFLTVGLVIGTPLCTYTFIKYRKLWHNTNRETSAPTPSRHLAS